MATKREQLFQMFIDIDKNQDGILSPQEISYYMSVHGYTPEQIQGFWNTFDINRDGYVTLREFNHYLNSLPPEYPSLGPKDIYVPPDPYTPYPSAVLRGSSSIEPPCTFTNPILRKVPMAKVSRSTGPDEPIDKSYFEPNHNNNPDGSDRIDSMSASSTTTPPVRKDRTRSGHIIDEEKIRLIFRYFDKDSSGRLELEELKDLLNRLANGEGDEFLRKWLGTGENSGLTCDDLIQFLKQS